MNIKIGVDSMHVIEINSEIWELSSCSCQYWKKNFICKHVIGIGYQLELLKFPTLDLNIEKNSKRGRRKKALPALERNSTSPLNVKIFRSIQANIEPSIQTQSAKTSNQILSIGGNNQLLENQNGQTAKQNIFSSFENLYYVTINKRPQLCLGVVQYYKV
ncbi:hypothetical protein BpHYR1_040026 [Brachionus plicatilis]|uniref:SWIM-type domain-containing protein n=1 Tax=Brachionus plicatilis TaxID=10195 RepID=A0A3M7T1B9_BRAPC|nr:hypothetical protein BpHYR1_040026 [Brachionus plicatilis]